MNNVTKLSDRRPPVCYTIDLVHHWDDRLEIFVRDVNDDERSRESIADALVRAASMLRDPRNTTERAK